MSAIAILVRAVVIGLAMPLAGWLFDVVTTGPDSAGANIGAGLFAFAVGALLSAVWSFIDARRSSIGLGTLVLRWLAVAVLAALILWVVPVVLGRQEGLVADDLATVVPFLVADLFIPAVIGAVIGSSLRRGGTQGA